MAIKYQDYLAAQVLNEGNIVNYRLLSRVLKVHGNVAKQMLYEFHRAQNARKPQSLHATYLVCGVQKPVEESAINGVHSTTAEDVTMADESFLSSSMPEGDQEEEQPSEVVPVTSVTLVREEHLEDLKSRHSAVHSIHVYSLEPGELQNIQIISDCARRVRLETATEDPLDTWKQYGTIHNPYAKRRQTARPPPPLPITAPTTSAMKPSTSEAPATVKATTSNSRPSLSGKDTTGTKPGAKPATSIRPAPTLKRDSSSLAKSFAKTKAVPPKASTSVSQSQTEDSPMRDASDDEDEDEDFAAGLPGTRSKADGGNAESRAKAEAAKKAKQERESALKDMMEDDDDDDDDDKPHEDAETADSATDSPPPPPSAVPAQPEPESKPEAAPTASVTVSNGRRRGRRQIMKKKTTKDAEGYLVTKEEPAWESFSEDESAGVKEKAKAPIVGMKKSTGDLKASGKSAGGSAGAKAGQGKIMNFFTKK